MVLTAKEALDRTLARKKELEDAEAAKQALADGMLETLAARIEEKIVAVKYDAAIEVADNVANAMAIEILSRTLDELGYTKKITPPPQPGGTYLVFVSWDPKAQELTAAEQAARI